jgi:8-oxo-dGTP pyrophosphatase MutT (NUDIX family)
MHNLPELLRKRLQQGLPGDVAHSKMMSYKRSSASEMRAESGSYREGAVLCLLYPDKGLWHTVLIKRPEYQGTHSAQVAFPGGAREKDDLNLRETALREAKEEVGIDPSTIEIIAELSEIYIPPSKFLVQPVLAWTDKKPDFKADEREVASILETPLQWLIEPGRIREKNIYLAQYQVSIKAPYYDVHEEVVWGATAMMISELCDLLPEELPKP